MKAMRVLRAKAPAKSLLVRPSLMSRASPLYVCPNPGPHLEPDSLIVSAMRHAQNSEGRQRLRIDNNSLRRRLARSCSRRGLFWLDGAQRSEARKKNRPSTHLLPATRRPHSLHCALFFNFL